MLYVNVYRKSQEYGGSEEGGWYYTNYEPIQCRQARKKRAAKKHRKRLAAMYEPRSTGYGKLLGASWPSEEVSDPYSLEGCEVGSDYVVCVDGSAYERAMIGRPHYE